MTKQRYVAHKVGDRYELRPQSVEAHAVSLGWALGGGALALLGLTRRSIPGTLIALVGGGMVYRGVSGRDPVRLVRELINWEPTATPSDTPSYQHDFRGRATQKPRDEVEEASMESFPASDPPASMSAQLPKG